MQNIQIYCLYKILVPICKIICNICNTNFYMQNMRRPVCWWMSKIDGGSQARPGPQPGPAPIQGTATRTRTGACQAVLKSWTRKVSSPAPAQPVWPVNLWDSFRVRLIRVAECSVEFGPYPLHKPAVICSMKHIYTGEKHSEMRNTNWPDAEFKRI